MEPHTETLILRGRILRDSGELYAAEVAFEGARHSASHDAQQTVIEHEIAITRRAGAYPPTWIRKPTEGETWFAEHGAVVIATETSDRIPTDDELEQGLIELIGDRGWSFGELATPDDPARWKGLAEALDLNIVPLRELNPDRTPLLVSIHPASPHGGYRPRCPAATPG